MTLPWDTRLSNQDRASKDFTEGQRIKRIGKHEHAGHRADFYWIAEGKTLKIYIEESRQRKDWKDNFDMFRSRFNPISKGKYHRGFCINAEIVVSKLDAILSNYLELEIYSYSQGAAVAQIVSDIITVKSAIYISNLVTFGCPNNVKRSRLIEFLRTRHRHYVQGADFAFHWIFWLKKYGKTIKLKGRGTPFHSHSYYHLEKK